MAASEPWRPFRVSVRVVPGRNGVAGPMIFLTVERVDPRPSLNCSWNRGSICGTGRRRVEESAGGRRRRSRRLQEGLDRDSAPRRRIRAGACARRSGSSCSRSRPCVVVAVDVPIGLPSVEAWTRNADGSARQFLGVRRNSVFWTLPRLVLDQPSHQAAIKMCEAHGRAKVSAQAYALRERIFEAERVAELDGRVYEVHPEVCFCVGRRAARALEADVVRRHGAP